MNLGFSHVSVSLLLETLLLLLLLLCRWTPSLALSAGLMLFVGSNSRSFWS
jgi:hypothetical protein